MTTDADIERARLLSETDRLARENSELELQQLRAEVARLRADNKRLRGHAPSHRQAAEGTRSRRELLTRASTAIGIVTASALAANVVGVERAAAADEPMKTGAINTTNQTTEIRYNFPIGGTPRSHVFAVQDGVWEAQVPNAAGGANGFRAAVAGYAGNNAVLGGFFQTNSGEVGSAGLRGIGERAESYGIRMQGRKAALLIDRYPDQPAAPSRLDTHVAGEIVFDSAGDLWFCVASGTPGAWRKLSGPATSGQIHLLDAPVRCYDSRDGQAPLAVTKGVITEPRLIDCRVTSDGRAAVVAADATGLIVNVTVTEPTTAGFCAVYPGGTSYTGTSLLNFAAGQTIANSTTIGCGPGATLTVRLGGGAIGHVIIDITGFYR